MHYIQELIGIEINSNKTILVTSTDVKNQILLYRLENNIIDNIKIMTENEYMQMFVFKSDVQRVLHLMEHNPWGKETLNVSVAKELEKSLFLINTLKITKHELYPLLKEMENEGLTNFDSSAPIGYDVKIYLPRVNDLVNSVLDYDNLIEKKSKVNIDRYDYYLDEIEQTIEYILSLIEKGVNLDAIHLFAPNEYKQLIVQFAQVYKLPIKSENDFKIYSDIEVQNVLSDIKQNNEIDLSQVSPLICEPAIEILNKYVEFDNPLVIKLIEDDFKQKSLTLNEEGGLEIKSSIDSLFTKADFENDYFILIGNYQDGLIKYNKDIDIIEDKYKPKKLTVEAKNEREDTLIYNILNNAKNLRVSYSNRVGIKKVTLANNLIGNEIINKNNNSVSNFSMAADQLKFARASYIKDTFNTKTKTYNHLNPYFAVDIKSNLFTNIEREYDQVMLSYTSINDYFQCSYKYYLRHVLRLKNGVSDNHNMLIGNIVHSVLENLDVKASITKEDIMELIKNYTLENQIKLKASDEIYFSKLSLYLETVCSYMKKEEELSGFSDIEREVSYEMDVTDNVKLTGKIDKVLSNIKGDDLFVEIYDYKTGSLSIDINGIEYGINMQNLIYYILLKSNHKYEEGQEILLGTFQQQIKPKILYDQEDILETMKIKGYCASKQENIFIRDQKIISEEEINSLTENVELKIVEVANNVNANKFKINPKIIKGKDISCSYCLYKNICNKTNHDYEYKN